MNQWDWIFGLLCLLATTAILFWNLNRTKKTMDAIGRMLDCALDGSFTEENFDESHLSALETKFANYLSASAVSDRNVALEKDKIKTLIADISHQTKTPISNLLLHSELLLEEPLAKSAKDSVEAIHAQSEKLRFLIDALVKLSRLENGIISFSPRPGTLRPMLEDVIGQFAQRAQAKGLLLTLDDSGACARFDPKWTAEALCNLVDNAVKYTPRGSVVISTARYELFTRIDITDSGPGILDEEKARIFSRFYRAENAKEEEGVGIGLYLAREIISGQGGYLKVSSTQNTGSTFSVFLPH